MLATTKTDRRMCLIADDDEFFRMALTAILTKEIGFEHVIEASSLDEAIDQLASHHTVSLALFDLSMPGMESPASLAAVRDYNSDMKIAVVSASTDRSNILSALATGVHGYVPKGIGPAELASALRLILAGTIYVPPSLAAHPPGENAGPLKADDAAQEHSLAMLTPRQRDVLEFVVEGKSNKEIARQLGLGEGTVKIHLAALFRSLGVRNRSAAAVAGARLRGSRTNSSQD